jgi:hypothetical protein
MMTHHPVSFVRGYNNAPMNRPPIIRPPNEADHMHPPHVAYAQVRHMHLPAQAMPIYDAPGYPSK